jgi:hypothetical protein
MGHGTKERDLPIFVSLKGTKQGETPVFHYKDNGKVTTGDYLSGYISKFTFDEFEHRGKIIQTYIMHLKDGDNKYQFEIPFNSMSRAILNCLMTVKFPGKVQIQVVVSKESGGYPSVFVSIDEGSALSWKWKYDEFSKLIDGEGDDKNYDRLNRMWTEKITQIIAPKFIEAFARMSKDGMFAGAAQSLDKEDPLKKAVEESSTLGESIKAKNFDVSDQIVKQEDKPEESTQVPDTEKNDLPF